MQIQNGFRFDDLVTGMSFKVVTGLRLDRFEITNIKGCEVDNRSLWFTKNGEFDGTESELKNCEQERSKK